MKFGIYLPNFGPFGDARLLADIAGEAERANWDGCFIWDHLVRSIVAPVVDPWIALSAMAMKTERIRIGALVTPLARRRPWKLARETVSLDHLCNGRLIFGVGLGGTSGQTVEWENFGEVSDLADRAVKMEEALDILMGLWSGKPFSFKGRHFEVKESIFLPAPVQRPRIPIWVAGSWPHKAPFRRAAKWDGAVPLVNPQPRQTPLLLMLELVEFLRKTRGDLKNFDIVYGTPPIPAKEKNRMGEIIAPYMKGGVTWWNEQIYPIHFGKDWTEEWPVSEMIRHIRQGPPTANDA
jgi:alkanesulfonate monooxygenase SsuD/methylene tetrahydromethanopterin reductase-like flavin-dependent oxidoreductase (luciferase family)